MAPQDQIKPWKVMMFRLKEGKSVNGKGDFWTIPSLQTNFEWRMDPSVVTTERESRGIVSRVLGWWHSLRQGMGIARGLMGIVDIENGVAGMGYDDVSWDAENVLFSWDPCDWYIYLHVILKNKQM